MTRCTTLPTQFNLRNNNTAYSLIARQTCLSWKRTLAQDNLSSSHVSLLFLTASSSQGKTNSFSQD
ncbi:hypothetical protein FRX31_008514 [Thalictrum thalictroides]|uniref:Uncharacterized protein n=1 Tax=Thalictrum thalictroides TaxID=46969 RepID=A0A7J6WWU0_THATH|nr:hypothetical protein FRX31_008514 [Thalictrum thalictroides]